jgi:predicted Zn-dependent peptidase
LAVREESQDVVRAETLPSGMRFITETMPHVRSVSLGVWLLRGSRHESDEQSGIAHFIEHMLFKGTEHRSARDIAQEIDSIGGQLDAFTAKEYAGYYLKVLDEHLPVAVDLLSDMVLRPAFQPDDIEREQGVILEEIKMVEDAPDDLVHEVLAQQFWPSHPLGRPILGTPESVGSFTQAGLRRYFGETYVAPQLLIAAAGNLDHDRLKDLVLRVFASAPAGVVVNGMAPPRVAAGLSHRQKDIEQSHVCLATPAYHQAHVDRHALYVLNTILGGSMSSRLFQHIREERGLAYAVFSTLAAYSDAGMFTVYAGCASERVPEVVDLALREMRGLRDVAVPADELRRAKDHLKGSLMLNLESTSSRMSHLARQSMFFERTFTLDEIIAAIEGVTAVDVQQVAKELFQDEGLAATVVGPAASSALPGPLSLSR